MRKRSATEQRDWLVEWSVDVVFSVLVAFGLSFLSAPTWACFAVAWLTFQTVRNRAVMLDRLTRLRR